MLYYLPPLDLQRTVYSVCPYSAFYFPLNVPIPSSTSQLTYSPSPILHWLHNHLLWFGPFFYISTDQLASISFMCGVDRQQRWSSWPGVKRAWMESYLNYNLMQGACKAGQWGPWHQISGKGKDSGNEQLWGWATNLAGCSKRIVTASSQKSQIASKFGVQIELPLISKCGLYSG